MDTSETSLVDRLKSDISTLCRVIGLRDRAHHDGLEKAAEFVRAELAAAGGRISIQPFEVNGMGYKNVLASFGPSEGERIVVGAHYDAVSDSPGADDNASGVAALLELGRRLGRASLTTPVELAAYSLEESAFATQDMGSIRHAQDLKNRGAGVRVMISLEMLGFYSDRPSSQGAPDPRLLEHYPNAGNFLMVVGRPEDQAWTSLFEEKLDAVTPLSFYSINAPREVPGIDLSDHRNFWDAGFPALMITDTAFYRNPHYHMATDTPETLDFERYSQAVEAIGAVVIALASTQS